MTTTLNEALSATAANLAAIDPAVSQERIAEIDAAIAAVDETLEREQKNFAELADKIQRRERGVGVEEIDQGRAAEALLAGEDIATITAAVETVASLTDRKNTLAAGMRGLRARRQALDASRLGSKLELARQIGDALQPLVAPLEEQARAAAAQLAKVFGDVKAAALAGNNEDIANVSRRLDQAIAHLAEHGFIGRGPIEVSGELLTALSAGDEAMAHTRRSPPQAVDVPRVESGDNPYLSAAYTREAHRATG
jgi:chromosome segregation ATPase